MKRTALSLGAVIATAGCTTYHLASNPTMTVVVDGKGCPGVPDFGVDACSDTKKDCVNMPKGNVVTVDPKGGPVALQFDPFGASTITVDRKRDFSTKDGKKGATYTFTVVPATPNPSCPRIDPQIILN